MHFTPSQAARSLAEGRHAANGIVFPDLFGPYYAEVLLGYEGVAGELDRSVLVLTTHGRDSLREVMLDLAGRVDGMVVLGRTVDDGVLVDIAETGLPLVLVARPAIPGVGAVRAENRRTAAALAGHLVDHGYRRFAVLCDPDASTDGAERWAGFRARLSAAGVLAPRRPYRCTFDEQAGYEAARVLAARSRRPDVLVCANDEIALGAMSAVSELGLRIPQEIAVTGWDDVMTARHVGLTTVRQPMLELGATAARLLDDLINGKGKAPTTYVLETHLQVRTSCGAHHQEGEER